VERDGRILKDRARLQRELLPVVLRTAFPLLTRRNEHWVSCAASRAGHTVRPTLRNQVFEAVVWVSKINNRFLECLRITCHAKNFTKIRPLRQLYYYPKLGG